MKTVFRSRWRALWWCAGVLLTAYCSVPSPDDDAKAPMVKSEHVHVNPWAKDAPAE